MDQLLTNPNIIYLLFVAGFILAVLAMFAPGTGVIEVAALFLIVLAGVGIANTPINLWALAVLVLGTLPFLIALRRSPRLLYFILMMAALIVGSLFLFPSPTGLIAIDPLLAVVVSASSGGLMWLIAHKSLEAMDQPVKNVDDVIGRTGEALADFEVEGPVRAGGETWTARTKTALKTGAQVRVLSREGLVLTVEPLKDK